MFNFFLLVAVNSIFPHFWLFPAEKGELVKVENIFFNLIREISDHFKQLPPQSFRCNGAAQYTGLWAR